MTPLFKETFMAGEIQPGSADAPYLKTGDLFARAFLGLTAMLLLVQWQRTRARTQTPKDSPP
jgi:apolipoprotein N-acyltransferase